MIKQKTNNKGVNPIIGVILMVSITIMIAYVTAVSVLDMEKESNKYNEDSVDYNIDTTDSNINITINSINNKNIKFVKVTNPEGKIIGIAENENQTITDERLDGSYNIFVVTNNDEEYYIDSIEV